MKCPHGHDFGPDYNRFLACDYCPPSRRLACHTHDSTIADHYIVVCFDDARQSRLATRTVFKTREAAEHYVLQIDGSRMPLIVACGCNTVILRKELL
jgi:hypothetical protein